MEIDILKIAMIIGGVFLVVMILWRLSSHRYQLPCPTWLGWLVELDNPLTKVHQAKTIVHNLGLEKGMTILDVGCGPGRVTIPLAIAVGSRGHITAMDLQKGMLDKTQKKAQALKLTNITFLHAQIGARKLEHNQFDRVTLVAVLGEIPNQEIALKEIYDALKPKGVLSITETMFDPHYQRRSKILKMASSLGYKEKQTFGGFFAYTLNLKKP